MDLIYPWLHASDDKWFGDLCIFLFCLAETFFHPKKFTQENWFKHKNMALREFKWKLNIVIFKLLKFNWMYFRDLISNPYFQCISHLMFDPNPYDESLDKSPDKLEVPN